MIRGDKQADRANPGPGTYLTSVLEKSISRNSKCGSMGYISNSPDPKSSGGRAFKGSMFDTGTHENPGPQHYQKELPLTGITAFRLSKSKMYLTSQMSSASQGRVS
mgnify:CR=1 FL=1